jgi:hypothetical protein
MIIALDLVPLRHCAVDRPVVKAPAPKDAFGTVVSTRAPIRWNHVDVSRKGVLAPFPDVARHIVETELVRRLPRNLFGAIASLAVVPRHEVDVVAATEAKHVRPVGTSACGVLHSVSVGRRKGAASGAWATICVRISLWLIRSRKPPGRVMSSHDTFSTGSAPPRPIEGLFAAPMTCVQSGSITGTVAIKKLGTSIRWMSWPSSNE